MKVHPAADLFPLLTGEDYEALREDIRKHGQYEPCIIWRADDGESLIDGRNRWRACEELGIEPLTAPFDGTEQEALDLVVSLNLRRRHLTAGQRATLAVELLPMYEAIAAKKTGGRPKNGDGKPSQSFDPVSKNENRASAQAAAATGANRQYVSDAAKLKAADPAAFEEVKQGKTTLPQAKAKTNPTKPKSPKPDTDHSLDKSDLVANIIKAIASLSESDRAVVVHVVNSRWTKEGTAR